MAEWTEEQRRRGVDRIAATGTESTDPEAWLADQLAQLPSYGTTSGDVIVDMEPGEPGFQATLKIAQEYGEMCAVRELAKYEDLTIVTKDENGLHVLVGGVEIKPLAEVFPDGGTALRQMGAGPLAVVHGLDDGEVVR